METSTSACHPSRPRKPRADTVSLLSLSRFTDIHPGGAGVLLASDIAGKDASEAFFSLHRSSVLAKYKRLIIGKLDSDASASSTKYVLPLDGELSPVPYAEPSWLVPSYKSPYFKDSHRRLQKAMRKFFDENVKAEAREFELSGERPTQKLVELMGTDEWNIHAMRMGPGASGNFR